MPADTSRRRPACTDQRPPGPGTAAARPFARPRDAAARAAGAAPVGRRPTPFAVPQAAAVAGAWVGRGTARVETQPERPKELRPAKAERSAAGRAAKAPAAAAADAAAVLDRVAARLRRAELPLPVAARAPRSEAAVLAVVLAALLESSSEAPPSTSVARPTVDG